MFRWSWFVAISAAAAVVSHTPAQAGGMAQPYPVAGPPSYYSNYNWQGFGLGVSGGAGAFVLESDFLDSLDGDHSHTNGIGGEGLIGDVFATYDWMLCDRFVVGGQIEGSWSSMSSDTTFTDEDGTYTVAWGPTGMFSLLGRAGYLLNDATMLYGMVGWTHAHFDLDYATTEPDANNNGQSDSDHDGVSLGFGLETWISQSTTLKVEYRYTGFDSVRFVDPDDGDITTIEPSMHVGRIGAAVHY